MNNQQTDVLQASIRLISKLDLKKFIFEFVSYYVVVNLILFVLGGSFQWIFLIVVFVFTGLYLLVKHWINRRQLKKIVMGQFDFVKTNHPDLSLFIPIMEKNSSHYSINRAALYFIHDKLYLDAFRQTGFASIPSESISIPYGDDFVIKEAFQTNDALLFNGQLIDTAYTFAVARQPELIEALRPYYPKNEKEV